MSDNLDESQYLRLIETEYDRLRQVKSVLQRTCPVCTMANIIYHEDANTLIEAIDCQSAVVTIKGEWNEVDEAYEEIHLTTCPPDVQRRCNAYCYHSTALMNDIKSMIDEIRHKIREVKGYV